jgi:4-aminobutyrate aminotransferase
MVHESKSKIPDIKTELPGPLTKQALKIDEEYRWPTLSPHPPVVWDKAKGVIVEDLDGNKFIDFSCGVLVTNTGHCHPKVVKAIKDQLEKLIHCYDFAHSVRYKAYSKLAEILPGNLKRILLLSTGTEGIEASIKVARAYKKKFEILSFFGAFHGRTYFSSSLGSFKPPQYGPYIGNIIMAPYAYCYRCFYDKTYPECKLYCVSILEEIIRYSSSGNIAALVVEPYQGSSGNIIPPKEYIPMLKKFCEEHDMLFIADEVQSSFARTGKWFAIEHYNVIPDIIVAAKGIASGIPTSMVAARDELVKDLSPGSMSSTFGNNPISCAAIIATIEVIQNENLLENATKMGEYTLKRLKELEENNKYVGDVRGLGLAIAVEFVKDKKTKKPAPEIAERIVKLSFEKGLLLLNPIGIYHNCIRLAPSPIINKELLEKGLSIFEDVLKSVE